jgi:hypothetical protein
MSTMWLLVDARRTMHPVEITEETSLYMRMLMMRMRMYPLHGVPVSKEHLRDVLPQDDTD